VTGVGGYLPDRVVTNDDLSKFVDTSDEWIVERTGIRQRHQARDDEPVSDLAVAAARRALEAAGRKPEDVDLIVVATTTADLTFPAVATIVQRKLGCPIGVAFDIQAVCSGFVYGIVTADSYLKNGVARRAACTARSEVNSPSAAMWRCLMPTRCWIHSSEVSMVFDSSSLVMMRAGR